MGSKELLATYLGEIGKTPLLTAEEEITLGHKVQKGDREASEKLMKSSLRLVVTMARRYIHCGMPLLDLIEEGNIGLMRAVERFDPEAGCRFSTYATWWIRQAITRALSNSSRTIRIPAHIVEKVSQFRRKSQALYSSIGREPSVEEMAEEMNLSKEETVRLFELAQDTRALDIVAETVDDEETNACWDRNARVGQVDNVRALVEHINDGQQVDALLSQLTAREALIMRYRFGMEGNGYHSLQETGQHVSLTRERVRQIERRCLDKMRRYARRHSTDFTYTFLQPAAIAS
jgi:RNA polymerase primary sigma factor